MEITFDPFVTRKFTCDGAGRAKASFNPKQTTCKMTDNRTNGNVLCSFTFGHLDEGEISGGASATLSGRPLHGNNYELSEFDTRGPTYRYDLSNTIPEIPDNN